MIVDLHWESLGGHIYFKHIFQYISLKSWSWTAAGN